MEILIDDNNKLAEIQMEFSKHFPFLKLEFFNFDPIAKDIFSKKNLIVDTNKTIGEIRHIHNLGTISINGHQMVSSLEQHFIQYFGIYIQVFRKSGNAWLLTSTTDSWTLSEQNKMGEEMSHAVKEEIVDDFDQFREIP